MSVATIFDSNSVLASVFARGMVWKPGGEEIQLRSGITPQNAQRLYEIVRRCRPQHVLEIGMAHGISTLSILTALHESGTGLLTSIDPRESDMWQGVGLELVRRAGLSSFHRLIEQPDFYALPDLMRESYSCDFAYIDGMHSFEFTFLDFFYIDKMLSVGGTIAFNDCGMPAVLKVIAYMASHTSYVEEDAIPLTPQAEKGMKFWQYPDRYFRKVRADDVPWDFFQDF